MLRHLLLLLFGLPAALMSQPLGRLTENPSYYSYRGKPLLIVSSGEHYGAVVNEDFDWRRYLAALEPRA